MGESISERIFFFLSIARRLRARFFFVNEFLRGRCAVGIEVFVDARWLDGSATVPICWKCRIDAVSEGWGCVDECLDDWYAQRFVREKMKVGAM